MATNEGRRPVPRAIIEVRNLRKEYPVEDETVVALDRVNLSIPQGQICCIFGESGSGKSTLLNQLAGMEKPTRGGVRIGGVPVSKLDERELAAFRQKHLGFVFQSYNLLPNLTALENVAMPLMFRGVPKEQRERAVDALFAVLEASGAGSISAMMAAGPKVIPEMLGTYVGLSIEDRRNLNQALGIMLQAALARNPKVRRR